MHLDCFVMTIPENVKGSIITLWADERISNQFRSCMQSGEYSDITETFRLIVFKKAQLLLLLTYIGKSVEG